MQRSSGCALAARRLCRAFNLDRSPSAFDLPLYFCPAFRSLSLGNPTARRPQSRPESRWTQVRQLHAQSVSAPSAEGQPELAQKPQRTLPLQCPGCGAFSQTAVPSDAGYYNLSRKSVMQYLGLERPKEAKKPRKADQIVQEVLQSVDVEALECQGIDLKSLLPESKPASAATTEPDKPPVCDRCHNLIHHSTGNSIYHPSIESLRETIEESPYKYNHVYHVLDAADFPMSLLPRLHSLMDIKLRPRNRRSDPVNFRHGKKTEMSFIITRSDLLAPTKEQVDALMPYLQSVLRDALGRVGERVRLGNVHCVSAKRAWWTKQLKEEIWERGGAGWMVGKVNVGKSQLFEAVYPKGRMDEKPPKQQISIKVFPKTQTNANPPLAEPEQDSEDSNPLLPGRTAMPDDDFPLLPPPLPETNYPPMPVVSSLPGTTASPIRVPFGNGRGELIDLPGLSRGDLELHVREEKRKNLIMTERIVPETYAVTPGRSLLIGGFIRLTPRNVAPDEELVFIMYPFTPIKAHCTSTRKAVAVQTEAEDAPNVENIALPGTGATIKHAGAFQVRYDTTKKQARAVLDRTGVKADRLPFRVLGIDILIEGCGWVEVEVQVRTKKLFGSPSASSSATSATATIREGEKDGGDGLGEVASTSEWMEKLDLRPEPVNAEEKEGSGKDGQPEPNWPIIDVYSPEGRFIGYRRPMNGFVINRKPHKNQRGRPRKSMKGAKKLAKAARREEE